MYQKKTIPNRNKSNANERTNEKKYSKAALRGVAIQRGRAARAAYPTAGTAAAAAAAAAAFRLPTPLAAAAGAANALHGFAP